MSTNNIDISKNSVQIIHQYLITLQPLFNMSTLTMLEATIKKIINQATVSSNDTPVTLSDSTPIEFESIYKWKEAIDHQLKKTPPNISSNEFIYIKEIYRWLNDINFKLNQLNHRIQLLNTSTTESFNNPNETAIWTSFTTQLSKIIKQVSIQNITTKNETLIILTQHWNTHLSTVENDELKQQEGTIKNFLQMTINQTIILGKINNKKMWQKKLSTYSIEPFDLTPYENEINRKLKN